MKADGDLQTAANRACIEHTSALKLMRRKNRHWDPRVSMLRECASGNVDVSVQILTIIPSSTKVLPVSSTRLDGIAAVWDAMQEYVVLLQAIFLIPFFSNRSRTFVLHMYRYREAMGTRLFELRAKQYKVESVCVIEAGSGRLSMSP